MILLIKNDDEDIKNRIIQLHDFEERASLIIFE